MPNILFVVISFLFLASCNILKTEVHHITPPKLDDDHIGSKVIGYRPWREAEPNMSVELRGNKVIAHNYGHGGSGWTIAPGGSEYVHSLLVSSPFAQDLTKDTPIAVIGSGVTGMFTAYYLVKNGYSNITIYSDKNFDQIVSSVAGGIWEPAYMADDNSILEKPILDSYLFYKNIIDGKNTDITGVEFKPLYAGSSMVFSKFISKKIMRKPKKVIVDFDNGVTHELFFYEDNIAMDPDRIMLSMTTYLKKSGVKFLNRTIKSFDQVNAKYIFNCTGLGSANLNKDDRLLPIQGHLIFLINQDPQIGYYFFSSSKATIGITPSRQRVERGTMLYPRETKEGVGIIGWTGVFNGDESTPNDQEFDLIIKRTRKFFTGK